MAGQERRLKPAGEWRYRVFGSASFAGNPVSLHELSTPPNREALLFHADTSDTMDNIYFWHDSAERTVHARALSRHREIQVCGHGLLALAHHLLAGGAPASLDIITPGFTHACVKSRRTVSLSLPVFDHREQSQPQLQSLLHEAGIRPLRLFQCDNAVWVAQCSLAALNTFNRGRFPWQQLTPLMPGALILTAAMPGGNYALRYFSPWYGKPEDSATGSAQCYLAPLWLARGQTAIVKQPGPEGSATLHVTRQNDSIELQGSVVRDQSGAEDD